MSAIDKCLAILRATHDGDDLAGWHMGLIQLCVNGDANEAGLAELDTIYQQVTGPGYTRPWHCCVEHVTKDTEGFIYWKGAQVEHFSHMTYEEECEETAKLAQRCLSLEKKGVKVNGSALWALYCELAAQTSA